MKSKLKYKFNKQKNDKVVFKVSLTIFSVFKFQVTVCKWFILFEINLNIFK